MGIVGITVYTQVRGTLWIKVYCVEEWCSGDKQVGMSIRLDWRLGHLSLESVMSNSFLRKESLLHIVFLYPDAQMATSNKILEVTLRWTNFQSKGKSNPPKNQQPQYQV